jgi:P4 family phage/plasmid primase-like protien
VTEIYGRYAAEYLRKGYSPLPLPKGKKKWPPKGYTGPEGIMAPGPDVYQWAELHPEGNIALRVPMNVIGIDVDDYGAKTGATSMKRAVELLGKLPVIGRLTSRYEEDKVSGIRFFRIPAGTKVVAQFSSADLGPDVEIIQYHHRYAVGPGSIHPDTGLSYEWVLPSGEFGEFPAVDDLPELPEAWLEALTPKRAEVPESEADHAAYDAMDQATQNRVQAYMDKTVPRVLAELEAMKSWPADYRDENGHGWEEGVLARTLRLAQWVKADWNTYTADEALRDLKKSLPRDAGFPLEGGLGKFVRALNNDQIAGAWYPLSDDIDLFDGVEDRSPGKALAGDEPEDQGEPTAHGDSQFSVEFSPKGCFKVDEEGKPKGLLPYTTAERLLKSWPIAKQALSRGRSWWAYRDGVWLANDEIVRASLARSLKDKYKTADVAPVEDTLGTMVPELAIEPHPDFINMRNGMLEWRTGELHEHSPKYHSTVQIPHSWNADSDCPKFDEWLSQRLPVAGVRLAWELIAISLYSGNPIQRAGLLYGVGKSGKSTYLEVVQGLLGRGNCSALSPQAMTKTVFATHALLGKQANIVTDIDPTKVAETATFKQVVASESIPAQQKNKPEFTFAPFCNHLFSANQIPRTADRTSAWTRRFAILRFDHTIGGDTRIVERYDRILLQEAEGIISKAIRILPEVIRAGDFSIVEADQAEFEAATDFTVAFYEDAIQVTGNSEDFAATQQLAKAFSMWCGQHEIRNPPPWDDVALRLRDNPLADGPSKRAYIHGRQVRGWKGVKLTDEYKTLLSPTEQTWGGL